MRRLGFDVDYNARVEAQNRDNNQGEDSTDNKRSANTFLARLIMLPVAMQEQVMNELTAAFKATVEEMEGRGETPRSTKEIQGKVHVRQRAAFKGADIDRHNSTFHPPGHP